MEFSIVQQAENYFTFIKIFYEEIYVCRFNDLYSYGL